jgi:phenylacetate-CoA ligase
MRLITDQVKDDILDKSKPAYPATPRSAVPGSIWPAVPNADDALMLALLYQFEQSQWWSAAEIQAAQMSQVHQLLRHALTHSPFHQKRLAKWTLPSTMTFRDFQTLPILVRTDIRDHMAEILCRQIPKAHYPLSQIQTTGSTGRPVVMRKTAITRALIKAGYQRSHIWHGRDLHHKTAAIRALNSKAQQESAAGKQGYWSAGYNTGPLVSFNVTRPADEQMAWLENENPDYLLTFASNLLGLIRAFPDAAQRLPNLKGITNMGETLLPETREACAENWAIPLTDIYSTQEVGIVAIQCPEHSHYHLQGEALLVEVLDENDRITSPCQSFVMILATMWKPGNFAIAAVAYRC